MELRDGAHYLIRLALVVAHSDFRMLLRKTAANGNHQRIPLTVHERAADSVASVARHLVREILAQSEVAAGPVVEVAASPACPRRTSRVTDVAGFATLAWSAGSAMGLADLAMGRAPAEI